MEDRVELALRLPPRTSPKSHYQPQAGLMGKNICLQLPKTMVIQFVVTKVWQTPLDPAPDFS